MEDVISKTKMCCLAEWAAKLAAKQGRQICQCMPGRMLSAGMRQIETERHYVAMHRDPQGSDGQGLEPCMSLTEDLHLFRAVRASMPSGIVAARSMGQDLIAERHQATKTEAQARHQGTPKMLQTVGLVTLAEPRRPA